MFRVRTRPHTLWQAAYALCSRDHIMAYGTRVLSVEVRTSIVDSNCVRCAPGSHSGSSSLWPSARGQASLWCVALTAADAVTPSNAASAQVVVRLWRVFLTL